MDRSREARRASVAAANGLSRRRQRSTSLRDSPDYGQMELQETVRLRERVHKNDRDGDRELSNRNKRTRGDRYIQGSNRDEGEESTDDSVYNDEEDYEEEYRRVPRMLPLNSNQPSLLSSSLSNHSHRRSFAPARVVRSSPVWQAAAEMIGVPVPRKARSASTKRSHENWVTGGVGFGEEQNSRGRLTSPANRSINGVSPSSFSVSAKKKMRPIGPKTRLPKVSSKPPSSSSLVQDDIEIEVAEALYDLMKQSQSQSQFSKKLERTIQNSTEIVNSKETSAAIENKSICSAIDSTQTAPQTSNLPQDSGFSSTPLLGAGSKKRRPEGVKAEEESAANSVPPETQANSEQPTRMEAEISSEKLKKIGCEEACFDLGTSQAVAVSLESQEEAVKQEDDLKPPLEESGGGDVVVSKEEVPAPKEESPSCAKMDVDTVDSTATKANLMASEVETLPEAKFQIDLMAPPLMASSPERDDIIDLVSDPKVMAQDVKKTETVAKNEEKVEQTVKNKAVVGGGLEDKKMETQEPLNLDLEKPDQDNGSNKLPQLDQKQRQQSKASVLEGDKFAQSSSLPLPIAVAGWPGGLPSLRYMPPIHTIMPVRGSVGSSIAVQPPHFLFLQPRLKRCATHHYIACNIYHLQQVSMMNHIWPAAAGSSSVYGAKSYNLNVMPSAKNMILGNSLQIGVPAGNTSSTQDKGQGTTTISGLTGEDKSSEVANIMDVPWRKQLVLQQAPQPASAGNLLHGPAFFFPLSQHQAAAAETSNQSGPPKSATSAINGPLSSNSAVGAPVSSSLLPAAVSFNYPNLQQLQLQGAKSGVELIPPQAFALPFASVNGSGTASSLNFSSMAQNPAILQTLPDMARLGYQIAPAAQVVQQKGFQISEVKSGADSTSLDDGRKGILGKSPTSVGRSLTFSKVGRTNPSVITGTSAFDSSARTLNFVLSPVPGNWPSRSISTATTIASVAVNPPNSQQQKQLIQFQKQHVMQQQMQQQLSDTGRIKAPTSNNSQHSSSIAAKFLNNTPVFSQNLIQTNISAEPPQWRKSARTLASQNPSPSLAASTALTLKNLPYQSQQQVRTPQGQTQISFGQNPKSASTPQGQQIAINHQSASHLLVGSPLNSSISKCSDGSLKTASTGSKAGPTISALPSQQTESSTNGPSQKSSPVCGRNVPSILSTCPPHLFELKY